MFKYKSNSRENQDIVLLSILNYKKQGTYVEIGGSTPIKENTSFLLENEFNWYGISIEYNTSLVEEWKIRKNKCIFEDATAIDYDKLFEEYSMPNHIDFLQLDIDPPNNTLRALKKINFNKYSFSFITFEHDYYNGFSRERQESREILLSYGYTMLISDVMHKNLKFEDWYVKEDKMPNEKWKLYMDSEVNMDSESMSEKYINLLKE